MSTQDDDTVLGTMCEHLNNATRADKGTPLSRIQGILSQLPPSVRGRLGATTETIQLVKSPPGHRAKYQATRTELLREMANTSDPTPKQAVYQPGSDSIGNGLRGTIQAVNPSHAFILFGEGNKQHAYFFIDNVDMSLLQPEKSLNDLFSVGDKVHFDAQPNPKPTSYTKWWATDFNKVESAELVQVNGSRKEAFLSDNDIAELLLDPKEFSARRKLSGIKGAFFPNSKITGLVSAVEPNVMVLVPDAAAYSNGRKIRSFSELFKESAVLEDVDAFVDAIEVECDMWVAMFTWTGERPEHFPVEQSESVFHNSLALVMSEMPTDTHDLEAGDLGIFNTPPKFCSAPNIGHSIRVYPHSNLKAVNDNSALCEVQEPEGCRNVEFFTFYKNHVPLEGGGVLPLCVAGRKAFKRASNESLRVWPTAEGQGGTASHPCSTWQAQRTT
ncbi:uncharacterized protein [Dermacentor andersoni]|uniref:uncharacterized protein isoform X2 n=1 Tax=Dermacentor andersoni TaxID=34620 RepID=UPI002416EE4B|nr:uncharacterized protein LOC126548222 isoform X2 [Dermacentor andersoni]